MRDLVKWQQVAANGVTPSNLHNKVKISTTNSTGFTVYNDDATSVDLVRYTGNDKGNGWYWSDSQMLVSNEADDTYQAETYLRQDDSAPAGESLLKNGFKWEISDRTHRIALGGTTKAEYEYLPGKSVQTEKISEVVKNVKVHGIILNKGANTPSITKADAEAVIYQANETYAQIGIRIIGNVESPVDAPADVNLERDGLEMPSSNDANGKNTIPVATKSLLDPKAPYKSLQTIATDDIEMFFVNILTRGDKLKAGFALNASLVPEAKYADTVFIPGKFYTSRFAVPHEIGHILLDDGDHVTGKDSKINLMFADASAYDTVRAIKRLTVAQYLAMTTKRPNLLT